MLQNLEAVMAPATAARKSSKVAIPVIQQEQQDSYAFESTLHERIAERAYQLFEQNGAEHGHDLAHWLQAEAEIIARIPEVRESGSWLTVNVAVPNVPTETISVLVDRNQALICAETTLPEVIPSDGFPTTGRNGLSTWTRQHPALI
jgi:hypothetical protein